MLSPVSPLSSSSVPLDLARSAEAFGSAGAATKASPADVQKAARQFEAILVRQLLSPAIEPLMNGGALGGSQGAGGQGGGVYGYFLTDTLAGSIASGGGLGLADVLTRQLAPAASTGLAETFADDPEPS